MKISVLLSLLLLAGCQSAMLVKPQQAPDQTEPVVVPAQTDPTVAEPAPVSLAISDDSDVLKAWVHYRASLLTQLKEQRESLATEGNNDAIWQLKRTMLQLHPDTPYLTRLRVQMQLAEQLQALPETLSALLSWDLAFNQKLLEAESAVSALTRLNAQQHDNIERLQKTNRELQKKIDALTQIEAQLNQPAPALENNNGR